MSKDWPWQDRPPWEATITPTRWRWFWNLDITRGLMGFREWPGPVFGTRRRAEAVARRKIRRLERADQRRADKTTITGGTT